MKQKALDFEAERIPTLFCKVFFPTLLGMLSIAAVSTIDGIFVGHGVGSDGIAAVNICIPLSMILTGVALMVGMGSSVIASIHFSRGKLLVARASVTQALLSVTIVGTAVIVAILSAPDSISRLLGASQSLMPLVKDYLLWFAPGLLFEMLVTMAQFAVRLDGAPRLAMWCNMACAVVNVFLDWLFIFPFGWGIMGAAFASTLSCMVGAIMAIIYLLFFACDLRLCKLKINRKSISFFFGDMAKQCKVGVSALLGEGTMATLMFMGNIIFMRYLGDDGVGAYGISCYYLPFVFMVGNSIAQSAQPIISYNYGLGDAVRVRSALHISLYAAAVCGLVSTTAFIFCPELLVSLFLPLNTETAHIAISGFPYYGTGFMFFIVNLAAIGYYQSIERIRSSMFYSLLRGIMLLVPSFLLIPQLFGVKGIWLAMPLSECATTAIMILIYVSFQCKTHSPK